MYRYIIIEKGKISVFKKCIIFAIPLYWLYCKINGYKLMLFERSDLN